MYTLEIKVKQDDETLLDEVLTGHSKKVVEERMAEIVQELTHTDGSITAVARKDAIECERFAEEIYDNLLPFMTPAEIIEKVEDFHEIMEGDVFHCTPKEDGWFGLNRGRKVELWTRNLPDEFFEVTE
jgi:hypothetical protein